MHAYSPILVPVVALVAWTILVMLWMFVARLRELPARSASRSAMIPRGARGVDLEGRRRRRRPVEIAQLQPSDGAADALLRDRADPRLDEFRRRHQLLAGVGLCRLPHPPQHGPGTVNVVLYRFACFALASFCLLGLTAHAGLRILHDCGIYRLKAGGELDVGRPAELADRLDPLQPIAAVGERLRIAREGRRVAADIRDPPRPLKRRAPATCSAAPARGGSRMTASNRFSSSGSSGRR